MLHFIPSASDSYNWLSDSMKINLYFHSYPATTNENFVGSSGIWTRTFGFLDRRSTHWAIESTGIGGESYIQLKWTKYLRHDLTPVLEDTECFNSISEPSSEMVKMVAV